MLNKTDLQSNYTHTMNLLRRSCKEIREHQQQLKECKKELLVFRGVLLEAIYINRQLQQLGYESNEKIFLAQKLLEIKSIQEDFLCPLLMDEIELLLSEDTLLPSNLNKDSFLVNLWQSILEFLEKISLFYVIRKYVAPNYTKQNYRFVDKWLVSHTILAVIYVVIAGIDNIPTSIKYIFLIYGSLRVFEILIYQLNVILVHPYNTNNYSLKSYRRMTIALIHNFFEIVFWFAGTYIVLKLLTNNNVPMAIYQSFINMVTYSMDIEKSKWSLVAITVLQFQALIGMLITILSLSRIISLFPQPASEDSKEQEANDQRFEIILSELADVKKMVSKIENK